MAASSRTPRTPGAGSEARLQALGFWFHDRAPDGLPLPQLLVGRWRSHDRDVVLLHLRRGRTLATYPTASWCRFGCGAEQLGRRDLSDGTFVWPEGLVHYVERHSVRLPPAFLRHVRSSAGPVPGRLPRLRFGLYDQQPWLDWARGQGACLALEGWVVPTADDARAIAAELTIGPGAHLALCRPATREVVLVLADDRLEIRCLRRGRPEVRRLAGWWEWPKQARRPRRRRQPPA